MLSSLYVKVTIAFSTLISVFKVECGREDGFQRTESRRQGGKEHGEKMASANRTFLLTLHFSPISRAWISHVYGDNLQN